MAYLSRGLSPAAQARSDVIAVSALLGMSLNIARTEDHGPSRKRANKSRLAYSKAEIQRSLPDGSGPANF
jgi:hypothetical protein